MIKSRLSKIENKLLFNEPSFIICTEYYVNGTMECEGKKYANKAEFESKVDLTGKNLVYLMNYRDDNGPFPSSSLPSNDTETGV